MVFYIKYNYFKYQVMSFGFFNAATSFQGYINKILTKKLDMFVIVYQDNILIYINEADYVNVVWLNLD